MDEKDLWGNDRINRDVNAIENQEEKEVESLEGNYQGEFDEAAKNQVDKEYVKGKKKFNRSIVTIIIISLLTGIVSGGLTAYFVIKNLGDQFIGKNAQNVEILPSDVDLNTAAAIAEKALPSVVGISTEVVYKSFFGDSVGEGIGTGVIVDEDGYILTNSHVVNDGDTELIKVMLNDGTEIKGELLWNDATLDLAIVKIEQGNLTPAVLGDSTKIKVGEYAVAIGNPLGFQFQKTVTQGIISGLNRSIQINQYQSIDDLIQTDASINPGNSGGPLLNQYGEVIGINTAKIQSGEGLGFAIPIHIAKPIVDSFIEKGTFTKVYLGIRGVNVEENTNSLPEDIKVDKGVYIYQIFTNSPAEKAGLQEKDVIVKMDDRKIDTMTQLVNELYKYKPGDSLTVQVLRNGETKDIEVTLEEQPAGFQ